jgi:phosphonate transport system substrate-binding protein
VFAVVSGAPDASRRLYTLCEGLRRACSRVVIPQVLQSYTELGRQFLRGSAHIAWAPPLLCLDMERTAVARAVLCCARGGRTLFHSALFVRKDSPVKTLQDLAGRSAAWVDKESSSGYVIPRLRLAAAGLSPARLFARESFLGTHAAVARAVLAGHADVGATYTTLDPSTRRPLNAGWGEAGAAIDAVHVLATAGPIPSDALVLSSALPPDLAIALVAGLTELPRAEPEAVRALFGADAFERPQTGHFDALQKLVVGAGKREWPPPSS